MLLESVVLERISTTNLVTVTLAQTQLEQNFAIILAALKSHDSALAQHNQKITSLELQLKESLQKQEKNGSDSNQSYQSLKAEIESAKKKFVEADLRMLKIEDNLETALRVNPENQKKDNEILQLQQLVKQLEEKTGKLSANVAKLELKTEQIDSISKQVQEEAVKVGALSAQATEQEATIKRLEEEIAKVKNELSSMRQRRPSTAKLNAMSQNESELKRLSGEVQQTREQLDRLSEGIEVKFVQLSQNGGNKEGLEDANKKIKKISDDVWKLNQQLYNSEKQHRDKEQSNQSQIDHLIKKINELADLLVPQNTTAGRTVSARHHLSTEWSPHPSALPDLQKRTAEESPHKEKDAEKDFDSASFRKEIIDKLKQQRSDFNKAIKRLDFAASKKEGDLSKLNELQERILRLEHLLDGKFDEDGLKKWMKYIENKIGYLYRIVNVQAHQQDACIARKNWICLSCDKRLEAYKGKVGNHLISAQLKGKTIDNEIVGGGMLFRNKSKYELPQFKK